MSENNMPERFEDAAADPTSRKRGGKWWTKRPAVIAGVAAGLLAVSGTAFAYWTSTGSGSGSATTDSGITVTINQTSTVTAMAPGVPPQALSGTFTASQPTYVGQVTAAVTGTTDAGCDATNFTVVQPTATNAEVTTGSTWGGGSIAFNNKAATNQDACKGVTVTIGYTSN